MEVLSYRNTNNSSAPCEMHRAEFTLKASSQMRLLRRRNEDYYKACEQVVLQTLWLSQNVTQSSRCTHKGHFNNLITFLMSVCDLIVTLLINAHDDEVMNI